MKIVRVLPAGADRPVFARDDGARLVPLVAAGRLPTLVEQPGAEALPADLPRLAPALPGKVVCVARNYVAHARELGNEVPDEPRLFLKPPSSVVGPGEAILRPDDLSELVHHEGELAVVMGTRLARARPEDALAAVFGYTCANDVTARDIQRREKDFGRAKGFDTFCPLGPCLLTADEVPDPAALHIRLSVDDEVRQDGPCSLMVFPVPVLLAAISQVMTLEPGDVVLTGTPEGVGPLEHGQTVRVEIPGIGVLENPVRDRARP